jgi:lipopolysaccharide/colanic/teichoic acid biosynthesis glycosyltransferase
MIDLIALPGLRYPDHARAAETSRSADLQATSERLPGYVREQVRALVGSGWVEEIVVRGQGRPEVLAQIVDAARQAGRRVRLISSNPAISLPPALNGERWRRDQNAESVSWVLVPRQPVRWQLGVKRVMDIVAAAALLLVLLPVLLLIAIAIGMTSGGPVLYRWRVVGENGRPFVGFKFRTMVREADSLKPDLLHLNERKGPVFKMAQDPRVTTLGRWLRKHSLDELPQLWSVLIGDMSLVGPRPAFASEYQKYELWQMRRLSVKPGLTCFWQLDGRQTVTEFSDWVQLDLRYMDTWSLRQDAAILFRTPMAVLKGTGH